MVVNQKHLFQTFDEKKLFFRSDWGAISVYSVSQRRTTSKATESVDFEKCRCWTSISHSVAVSSRHRVEFERTQIQIWLTCRTIFMQTRSPIVGLDQCFTFKSTLNSKISESQMTRELRNVSMCRRMSDAGSEGTAENVLCSAKVSEQNSRILRSH